ncbi:putative acetyltransferase [Gonapodya prolifera JEL478]|uniref:Putative acetyltransferase n=1 Tax=Gonapodya prolifera (strain JEL478) TaxID=1344416 RepID=A0A139AMW6_GONPJ|nr:putative acetyltransferase [Gonapodya prolifera JEL478]|eukprot:KXS18106.1 putative acetyltransferase [Gonapodya prolifera JEL478]
MVDPTDPIISQFLPRHQQSAQTLILRGLEARWGTLDPSLNPDLANIGASFANGVFLVAHAGDRLVGTGGYAPEPGHEDTVRVSRMSVDSEHRRQGIGWMILEELCERAKRAGMKRVVLETTKTWDDAIAFYTRYGFRTVNIDDDDRHFIMEL